MYFTRLVASLWFFMRGAIAKMKGAIAKPKAIKLYLLPVVGLFLLASPVIRAQEAIFIVRHAEVLAKPGDDDPPLSEEGLQRALRLAEKLKGAGITAIYSSETKRTQQTAEPSAKALKIPIKTVSRRDPKALVSAITSNNKNDRVLIFGHFQNIPWILKELGYQAEFKLDTKVWDEMLIVIPRGDGQPTVMRLRL